MIYRSKKGHCHIFFTHRVQNFIILKNIGGTDLLPTALPDEPLCSTWNNQPVVFILSRGQWDMLSGQMKYFKNISSVKKLNVWYHPFTVEFSHFVLWKCCTLEIFALDTLIRSRSMKSLGHLCLKFWWNVACMITILGNVKISYFSEIGSSTVKLWPFENWNKIVSGIWKQTANSEPFLLPLKWYPSINTFLSKSIWKVVDHAHFYNFKVECTILQKIYIFPYDNHAHQIHQNVRHGCVMHAIVWFGMKGRYGLSAGWPQFSVIPHEWRRYMADLKMSVALYFTLLSNSILKWWLDKFCND